MSNLNTDAIAAILGPVIEQLQAIGVSCLLSPLTLPQGAVITLNVGADIKGVLAADVATRKGVALASDVASAQEFNAEVVEALAGLTIKQAARGYAER
jgi:hypothetical protein